MSRRDRFTPRAAAGAHIDKQGEQWTLVLVRDLRHPPTTVWAALTQPEQLREWAPFDADRSLAVTGAARLSTVGAPAPVVADITVKRADAPRALEYNWGPQELRWELEPLDGGGTRLTLWHNIDKAYIAMGAAGWHLCFEVLEHLLAGDPLGRIVGAEAMKFEGWKRLYAEYGQLFGTSGKGAS
jgi:uncharacterized protein YndB with AHSA1/START domain